MRTENPFHPPRAATSGAPRRQGSPVAAVALGVAVDLGGSFLVGILMFGVTAAMLALEGTPQDQIAAALTNLEPTSWFMIVSYAIGCTFSCLGGYLCVRVAGHSEYELAGIVAAITTTAGFLLGASRVPLWLNGLLSLLTVASVLFGAWRGREHNRSLQRAS